jgi:hypothetical protein
MVSILMPHDHGHNVDRFSSVARHLNGSTGVTVLTAPIDKAILQGMSLYVGEVIRRVPGYIPWSVDGDPCYDR